MGYLTTLAIVFISSWCCFFLLLKNVFLDVAALFLRDLEWKSIPHVGAPTAGQARQRNVFERDLNKTTI